MRNKNRSKLKPKTILRAFDIPAFETVILVLIEKQLSFILNRYAFCSLCRKHELFPTDSVDLAQC